MKIKRRIYNGKAYWYYYDSKEKRVFLKRAKGEWKDKEKFAEWVIEELEGGEEEQELEVVFYVTEYFHNTKEITEYYQTMTKEEYEELLEMNKEELLEYVKSNVAEGWVTDVSIGVVEDERENKRRTRVQKQLKL